MNLQPARFRFGLRSLLGLVFVAAIFAAFPVLLHVLAWLVWITGPLLAFATFALVRHTVRLQHAAERWPTPTGWLFFAIIAAPFLECWFIRYRWGNAFSDDEWPRPFPYPDIYLHEIHDWWDRLHPVTTDALKMHGEYYAVLQGTNALVLVACGIFGAVAGYLFRDADFGAASRRLTWFLCSDPPDTP